MKSEAFAEEIEMLTPALDTPPQGSPDGYQKKGVAGEAKRIVIKKKGIDCGRIPVKAGSNGSNGA